VTRVVQFGSEPLYDQVLPVANLTEQVVEAKKNLSSLGIPVTVSELAYGMPTLRLESDDNAEGTNPQVISPLLALRLSWMCWTASIFTSYRMSRSFSTYGPTLTAFYSFFAQDTSTGE
jgi:hypothetical protein